MDDLANKLSGILNSDEGKSQLRSLMSMFGADANDMPDLSAILGGDTSGMPDLSSLFGNASASSKSSDATHSEKQKNGGGFDFGGIDIETLMRLQGILSHTKTDDKNSELLLALRPHLQDKNKQKVDQAVKILKLLSLLPLLRESGILGGDFFGL